MRAILVGADVAERTGTKGNHEERPGVDVEPEGRRRDVIRGGRNQHKPVFIRG